MNNHIFIEVVIPIDLLVTKNKSEKKNREALINASKEVGLEINVEKTKYMLLSRQQNVGQNWDMRIANRWSENASQFRYFGMIVTNQN
jgi:hypothetical protein